MKYYFFDVIFFTGQKESLWAFSFESAHIVAQARQILKGNRFDVKSIECVKLDEIHFYTKE